MGTCVAKNNLYAFYAFNTMWPLLMLYTCAACAVFVYIQLSAYIAETFFHHGDHNATNSSSTTTLVTLGN